ncbi:MAG: hypothetical protein AAFQ65_05530 [Myxococcota bacterium]
MFFSAIDERLCTAFKDRRVAKDTADIQLRKDEAARDPEDPIRILSKDRFFGHALAG